MSILTPRQSDELHRALMQYLEPKLTAANHHSTVKLLGLLLDVSPDSPPPAPNFLEKKWSTVLRLQKKILDLQNEINSYKALVELANQNGGSAVVSRNKLDWLPSSPNKVFPTKSSQIVNSIAVHPKLPLLVAGCTDGSMIAWGLATEDPLIPEKEWGAHLRSVHKVRWSPGHVDVESDVSDYILASCSSDLSIKIWAGDTLKHIRTLTGHEHTVSGIAFSAHNPNLLYSVSRDKSVKIWDLVDGYCIRTFVGHSDWVRDIDVISINTSLALNVLRRSEITSHEMGDFLVTCSNDQSIRLSHHSGTGLAMLLGHEHVIETVKFVPLLANRFLDKYILLHMDRFPYLSNAIVENEVYNQVLGFKYCVSAGRDNLIKVWLLPPPTLHAHRPPTPAIQNNLQGWHVFDILGHQLWVKCLDFHPSGRYLFSASDDKTIRVWDFGSLPEKGVISCTKTLAGHEGFVNAIHFAGFEMTSQKPDLSEDRTTSIEASMRCLFASAGTDNTVKTWG